MVNKNLTHLTLEPTCFIQLRGIASSWNESDADLWAVEGRCTNQRIGDGFFWLARIYIYIHIYIHIYIYIYIHIYIYIYIYIYTGNLNQCHPLHQKTVTVLSLPPWNPCVWWRLNHEWLSDCQKLSGSTDILGLSLCFNVLILFGKKHPHGPRNLSSLQKISIHISYIYIHFYSIHIHLYIMYNVLYVFFFGVIATTELGDVLCL